MLSRVAERVYWLARYLERVENTARLINVHTTLLLDLPEHMEVNWFTLVTIFDGEALYHQKHVAIEESNIMHFLMADNDFGSSLINSLTSLRENARTSLDTLPEDTWEQVNELYLLVKEELSSVSNRRRRQKLLLTIMERCQSIWGIISNHMSRNHAYSFIQMGKHLERADMTSRILEMTSLLVADNRSESLRQFEGLLWTNLLRALSAQQMYTQAKSPTVEASEVLSFLISDSAFPRSLRFSIKAVGYYLEYLPRPEKLIEMQQLLLHLLPGYDPALTRELTIHKKMDQLQSELAELNSQICSNWFYPVYSAA